MAVTKARDLNYFSTDDRQARERFLDLATNVREIRPRAALESFAVPSQTEDDLFVDLLTIPAIGDKQTLLVLSSGVHGVEAHTGSAIQLMFLNELLSEVPSSMGVQIFHVLNPYGFRHLRRGTEQNVNLNRNFSVGDQLFTTPTTEYDALVPRLSRAKQVMSVQRGFMESAWFMIEARLRYAYSTARLTQILSQGQFKHRFGLEYGGTRREPQTDFFIDRFSRAMREYRDILLFDLHTGLGDRYQLHLMPCQDEKTRDPQLWHRYFKPAADRALYAYTPADTPGFYDTFGDLITVLPELLTNEQRALGLTFEFGTIGTQPLAKVRTLSRLWLEARGLENGFASASVEKSVKQDFIAHFFPVEKRWRENAVHRGREVLRRVLARGNSRQAEVDLESRPLS